jgi:hypothetical protein
MMINLNPMLEEHRQSRGNPYMRRPELMKLVREHGDAAQRAIAKHWRNVELGLTSEYKQLEEL